jgi:putative DNA primase/helicase
MGVARRLLKDWTHNGLTTLLHWRGSWMHWQFTHWVEVEESTIRGKVYARLEEAVYLTSPKEKKGEEAPKMTLMDVVLSWRPNRHKVGDVMEAMKACVHLVESVDTPSWLPGAPMRNGAHLWPAELTVSCTNGLLDVTTRQLVDLTPGFFNRVSVPFNYDRRASADTLAAVSKPAMAR